MYTVYIIVGPTGKRYVGKTCQQFKDRWNLHKSLARRGKKHPLYAAMRKYGEASFDVEIIGTTFTSAEALYYETELIQAYGSLDRTRGYNLVIGGDWIPGYKHTEEALKKISQATRSQSMEVKRRRMESVLKSMRTKAYHDNMSRAITAMWAERKNKRASLT